MHVKRCDNGIITVDNRTYGGGDDNGTKWVNQWDTVTDHGSSMDAVMRQRQRQLSALWVAAAAAAAAGGAGSHRAV